MCILKGNYCHRGTCKNVMEYQRAETLSDVACSRSGAIYSHFLDTCVGSEACKFSETDAGEFALSTDALRIGSAFRTTFSWRKPRKKQKSGGILLQRMKSLIMSTTGLLMTNKPVKNGTRRNLRVLNRTDLIIRSSKRIKGVKFATIYMISNHCRH